MLAVVFQIYLDSLFAQNVHFSSWRFLQFNLLKGVSERYGRNVSVYYFIVALPALFTTGLWEVWRGWRMADASLMSKLYAVGPLLVYSLLPHKEIRFIMPLMPIGLSLMAKSLSSKPNSSRKGVLGVWLGLNVLLSGYFGFVHQRGPMMAAKYLSKYPTDARVLVLMPCHSLPHQGYILNSHLDIDSISCEPPASPIDDKNRIYRDETDLVYMDYPNRYYERVKEREYDLIVTFGELGFPGYKKIEKYFNGFYNPDWRRRGPVVIHKSTIK